MQKVFNYSGHGDIFPGGSIYPNPKDSSLFLSLGPQVDVYFPPCKRSRISAPFVCNEEIFEKQQPTIEVLPNECLFEVFRRLSRSQEKSSCACVSKRWLMLLSTIRSDEICSTETVESQETVEVILTKTSVTAKSSQKNGLFASDFESLEAEFEGQDLKGDGHLSRCLEGKKATDVRLAAIAVGTGSRGGLGKLSIRGSNSISEVTNVGLKAVARGCPSLRALSLWNLSSIGDEGLLEIANECHMLEKIDLCHCSEISDKAMLAIASNCPNLTSLAIDSCSGIGNESLQAVARLCPKLNSVSIKNCPLIGDQGVASLLSSASLSLAKIKLEALDISDLSLAVIGHYGKAVTDLALIGLQNLTEKGFWVMGNAQGLQKLRACAISACQGITDVGLEAVGKGCPNLKQFCLHKSVFISDNGLVSFAKDAVSLESLLLEECHRITQSGLFGVLLNRAGKLKSLSLEKCLGIKDFSFGFPMISLRASLRSLSIRNCPGFGNSSLAMLGKFCPELQYVDFSGSNQITDKGLFPLIESCEAGLKKVNLSNCLCLTDRAVVAISKMHGGTLEVLNLEGCTYVTDTSLVAIADNCFLLSQLNVSGSTITDNGIAALACAVQLYLQILSVSGCSVLTNKSLAFFVKLGENLEGLSIKHCNSISSNMVDLLVGKLWKCDILF